MANAQKVLQAHPSPQGTQAAETKIEVSAQILTFEPGLYSVDVSAPRSLRGVSGMVVPCIRLDPIHSTEQGRAFVSTLSDSALIEPGDTATYLRVQAAKASVLLTIYKLAGGMPAPELRITLVQPAAVAAADARSAMALASEKLTLMAHVERAGDLTVQGGLWAGQPGGRGAIEGFSVTPGDTVKPDDIEYQAVLGSDWTTPWLSGGEFCGSRGLSLPLLGARIRLRGEAAAMYSVSYWGSFIGAGEIGPVADGAVCSSGGASLEALRVVLTRRQTGNAVAAGRTGSVPATQSPAKPKAKPPAPVVKPIGKPAKDTKVTALHSIRSKLGRK